MDTIRLLDAQGQPLKVPVSKGNTVNPPASMDTYYFGSAAGQLSYGRHVPDLTANVARIGFAWSGTYCGPPAASVEVKVQGGWLVSPLTGPQPACRHHASSSLIPGALGGHGQAVVPAPVSWRALHARLVLPTTFSPGAIPVVVVLTNTGSEPVPLSDPCPTYVARGTLDSSGWSSGFGLPDANLCGEPGTIPPGKSMTFTLPSMDFPTTKIFPQLHVKSGDLLRLTWSIAGVPPATATTHIR
jgi:hypothetical protein